MSEQADVETVRGDRSDRRSSVRASSLLPCSFRAIDDDEVPAVEARILDLAVIEGDSSVDEQSMWDERNDELSRDVVLVLNEIRALRRKLAEIQRMVERGEADDMKPRWITINDRGFRVAEGDEETFEFEEGELLEVELQIPSVFTRNVLAVGEVVRVDVEGSEKGPGFAVEFRSISRIHEKAIMRYALLRERHLARTDRFSDHE
jgi:hypothetical protein